jgi:hypothetical protein
MFSFSFFLFPKRKIEKEIPRKKFSVGRPLAALVG